MWRLPREIPVGVQPNDGEDSTKTEDDNPLDGAFSLLAWGFLLFGHLP